MRDEGNWEAFLVGYNWPAEFRDLPDGTVVRVNRLWTKWLYGTARIMVELRVDDMEARRRAHASRYSLYHNLEEPLLIVMEYDEFKHPRRRVFSAFLGGAVQRIDIEHYLVRNDLLPPLDTEITG